MGESKYISNDEVVRLLKEGSASIVEDEGCFLMQTPTDIRGCALGALIVGFYGDGQMALREKGKAERERCTILFTYDGITLWIAKTVNIPFRLAKHIEKLHRHGESIAEIIRRIEQEEISVEQFEEGVWGL